MLNNFYSMWDKLSKLHEAVGHDAIVIKSDKSMAELLVSEEFKKQVFDTADAFKPDHWEVNGSDFGVIATTSDYLKLELTFEAHRSRDFEDEYDVDYNQFRIDIRDVEPGGSGRCICDERDVDKNDNAWKEAATKIAAEVKEYIEVGRQKDKERRAADEAAYAEKKAKWEAEAAAELERKKTERAAADKKVADAVAAGDTDTIEKIANEIYHRLCDIDYPIFYNDIEVSYAYGSRSWEDGSYEHEGTEEIEWEYKGATVGEICEAIIQDHWKDFLPAGTTGDEPDFSYQLWTEMEDNFEELYKKYEDEIVEYYREYAEDDAADHWEPDDYDW